MGTISNTVQQNMERFRQKQMKLDKLILPGHGESACYFHESDKKYGTSELRVLAVVKLRTDQDVAAPAPTTYGDIVGCLNIVHGILQMPQGTFQP
jgi:hypothetical protein